MSSGGPTGTVFTGTWVNWEYGVLHGATWTLSSNQGSYLVAFLALYVQIAGGHFWSIVSFFVFTSSASNRKGPQDGLHHQHQAIIRNSSAPAAIWKLYLAGKSWRNGTRKPASRSMLLIALALLHFIGFSIAGIYSSRVLDMESDVLLLPKKCGSAYSLTYTRSDTGQSITKGQLGTKDAALSMYRLSSLVQKSSDYVQNCLNENQPIDCDPFGRQMVTWQETNGTEIPCPFQSGMCTNGTVLRMDTGIIDSRSVLGINSKQTLGIRKVVECAPIETEAYTTGWAQAQDFINAAPADYFNETYSLYRSGSLMVFSYGPGILADDQPKPFENVTYIFNNNSLHIESEYNSQIDISPPVFILKSFPAYAGISREGESVFEPIKQLNRTDADVSLYTLFTTVYYDGPVNDPWFLATDPIELDDTYNKEIGYRNRRVGNTIACTEQYQFCDKGPTSCTAPTALNSFFDKEALPLGASMTNAKRSILMRMLKAMSSLTFEQTAYLLERPVLTSTVVMPSATSPPVPDNQWMLEFKHFFAASLVTFQQLVLDYISEPHDSPLLKYIEDVPADAAWMCQSQVVRRKGFSSFSILGISIILIIGGIFIVVGLFLESIMAWIGKKWARFQVVEWQLTSYLQLQRMAFKGRGRGTWSGLIDEVPTTLSGETFEPLEINDILAKQNTESSSSFGQKDTEKALH